MKNKKKNDHALDAAMTEQQVSQPEKVDPKKLKKAAIIAKLKKKLIKK